MLSAESQEWRDLTRGLTVRRLKAAGIPCVGICNHRPVLQDGTVADIERVREALSTLSLPQEEIPAPEPEPVKKKGRRKKK